MLKFIGLLLKMFIASVLILVLGQLITFGGKTLSDHVKVIVKYAEKDGSFTNLKKEAEDTLKKANELRSGFSNSEKRSPASIEKNEPNTAEVIQKFKEVNEKEKAALNGLLKDEH